jgi:putative ABC transport system permease protein
MDIALIRSMGAGKTKIFSMMILEGTILTLAGSLTGILLSHFLLEISGILFPSSQPAGISGGVFIVEEAGVFAFGIIIGIAASLIPAI